MESKRIKRLRELANQEHQANALLARLRVERRKLMTELHDPENEDLSFQKIADIYGVNDRRRIENIVKDR